MSHPHFRKFDIPAHMTDAEAYSELTANAANCHAIKSIAVRQGDDEPVLSGNWYKYTVDVKDKTVHVKPKMDTSKSMILTMICLPFALWVVWGVQDMFTDFLRQAALPVAALFIAFGIIYAIAYSFGGKEQKAVLPFIYNTLHKNTAENAVHTGNTGMFSSYFSAAASLILGIVILILHFVM